MKKFNFLSAILCMAIAISCATKGTPAESSINSDVTGSIMIYTSMYGDIVRDMEKTLQAKFPNAQISFTYGGTGVLQTKIANEESTGSLGCDIILVADPAYSYELKSKEMLFPINLSDAYEFAFDYEKNGCWYPVRMSSMVLAYNPELNLKDTLPNSFYDFAHDPNLKSAIAMPNPVTSGTALSAIAALKDKYGYEYFSALFKQEIKFETGTSAVSKLESGELKMIMVLEETILRQRELNNSKLEVIYPSDGIVVIPSNILIVNDDWNLNKNTPAALAIAEWYLSAEGQEAIVKEWMHSVIKDFPKTPYDSIPAKEITDNALYPDWEEIHKNRNDLLDKFEELAIYGR